RPTVSAATELDSQTASRFLLRLRFHPARGTPFDLRLHQDSAILPVVLVCPTIVDLVRFCFLLFPAKAVGSLAVGLCLLMDSGFRPVWIADFFAARFSPAPDSTYLRIFDSCLIGPAIALADFVVVAGFDFVLCRNC